VSRTWLAAVLAAVLAGCGAPASAAAQLAEEAERAVAQCRRLGPERKVDCYEAILMPRARAGDVRGSLALVEAIAQRDPDVHADGHMYVHAIGIAAYDDARPFGPQFDACTELFHAGCYHGLIQARFAASTTVDAGTLNELCAGVGRGGLDRWVVFQCVHGIGHGLVVHHGGDLPAALRDCDLLRSGWDRESCYGGAFMENIGAATHPHHAALAAEHLTRGGHHGHHGHDQGAAFEPLRAADPHYPCSIVDAKYLDACYAMQTSAILHLNGYDFAAAAVTCDGAPEAQRRVCHQSLGRDASGFAQRDHRETDRLCSLNRSPHAPWCWVGAAKAIVDWAGRPEDGLAFCRGIAAGLRRLRCFEAVGEQIAVIIADAGRGRALCDRFTGEDRSACAWGARLVDTAPAGLREPGG
jgi:hypothetical protein